MGIEDDQKFIIRALVKYLCIPEGDIIIKFDKKQDKCIINANGFVWAEISGPAYEAILNKYEEDTRTWN